MKFLKGLLAGLFGLALVAPAMAGGMACGAKHGGVSAGVPALLLLCLAAGYGVLVLSQYQTRPLDVIGRIIGGLVLIVSFIGLLCVAVCSFRCGSRNAGMCPYYGMKKGSACAMPMSKIDDAGSAPEAPEGQQ